MIKTQNVTTYKGFGYNIQSEIELPELMKTDFSYELADFMIEVGELAPKWNKLGNRNDFFIIEENGILFEIPETAVFFVKDGKKVIVSPQGTADERLIRLFILGTCMGAILMQRKVLPFHGSAIEIDGNAYAFVGDSGAGKSTLASAFMKQGYSLLSDDVIPIDFDQQQKPYINPSYPQQKLWQESLTQFEMASEDYPSIYGRETKYSIPVTSKFSNKRLPLAGIFELIASGNNQVSIHQITGLEKLHLIFRNTYRNFFIQPMGLMDWHFRCTTNILKHVPLYQLQRPVSGFTAQALISLIMQSINEGGSLNDK